jgi:excisionase family DNA binding protein
MSTNIRIQKVCVFCQKEFTAKTLVTKYCSHRCNQRDYKQVNRLQKIQSHKIVLSIKQEPKSQVDCFTISKSAALLGVSDRTIFRLIKRGIIKPIKKGRKVEIPQNELFKITVYENIDS